MVTTGTADLSDLALFTDGDPHQVWSWLRTHDPVYWNETATGGFWALTRYDDVSAAYADSATFSSRNGTVMGGSYRRDYDTATGSMLICSDPPQHRLLRQQVLKAFAPAMLERAGHVVRRYVRAALNRFEAAGGGDFAVEVAPELPAGFLAAMFGLDRDEAFRLLGLTRTMIGFQDEQYQDGGDPSMTLVRSQVEIFDLLAELVERRRADPGDDLISLLLAARVNGRPMPAKEVLYNGLNVAVGGNETTPFTATAAVLALIEHPVQAQRLVTEPDLLSTAVSEIFRWTSTNAYVQRTATRDVELGGELIRSGQPVTLWNASANRDTSQFPAADRLDLGRTPNRHIAFGVGAHRCIGMAAAQLEIGVLMEELAVRGLRFATAGPVRRLRSNFMLGITSLPVSVTSGPSRRAAGAP